MDIEQKDKLAQSLKNRYKGFIIISHDRDFINQTCNKIFELNNGKFEIFNGNYSFYLEERVKRMKFAKREYEKYIAEKKRLSSIVINIRNQSSKVRTTPKRMGNSEARLHKMGGQSNKKKLDSQAKAVESRIKQLEVKEKPKEEIPIKLTIPENEKIHSKILIKSKKLNKSFADKIIFNNANFEIENDSKVALIGENGSGKTTLLNMILNAEMWLQPNLKIGYYSQMGEILENEKTILDNIIESSIYNQTMTRIILARLGFKDNEVFKPIDVLSDGEKAKVKLAKVLTSDFNYLIMDEPTNFLDIRAIEVLEDLLKGYDRSLLFVTHDISFINNIANSLLIIKNHKIFSFKGNIEQYKKRKTQLTRNINSDDFLIDFILTSINNRLTMNISKEERADLEIEYNKLLNQKQSSLPN
ncbi:MAG: ATP-binding cassette domain-containing protein [Treponemataceae bacterium]